jgi:hypothetical protein
MVQRKKTNNGNTRIDAGGMVISLLDEKIYGSYARVSLKGV